MKTMLCALLSAGQIFLLVLSILLVIALVLFCIFVPIKVWMRALASKVFINPSKLYSLKSRVEDYMTIVEWYIIAKKAGCNLTLEDLETHVAIGGNLKNVVSGLISAKNAQIHLSVDTAKSLDMAGRDLEKLVGAIINHEVLTVPEFSAWSPDGKQIKISATITVKPILDKILTGTIEGTLISRVEEAMICGVSSLKDTNELLQNADVLSNTIVAKKLDYDSAFKIISIDIINIDIGRDLKHERMMEEREFEAKVAVSKAREQRELALLEEQKIKNLEEQKKVEELEAEAEIPKSIVKAFEEGKVDMLDYWKMQNLIADTNMRRSLVENFGRKIQTNGEYMEPDEDDDDERDSDSTYMNSDA